MTALDWFLVTYAIALCIGAWGLDHLAQHGLIDW